MTDEDLASVIVYIRSLPAVHNSLPKRKVSFEIKVDLHPETEPKLAADASEQVKGGWYLVRIAQRNDCHTAFNDEAGVARTEMMFGGGHAWRDLGETL